MKKKYWLLLFILLLYTLNLTVSAQTYLSGQIDLTLIQEGDIIYKGTQAIENKDAVVCLTCKKIWLPTYNKSGSADSYLARVIKVSTEHSSHNTGWANLNWWLSDSGQLVANTPYTIAMNEYYEGPKHTCTHVSNAKQITSAGGTLASGNYYLADDITLTSDLIVNSGTVNICLNGHVLKGSGSSSVIRVSNSYATLNIYDCNPTTPHKYTINSDGCWALNDSSGSNTVLGGAISNGTGYSGYGGGIYNTGTLTLNNINIIGNKGNGSIYNTYNLTVTGGNIIGNGSENNYQCGGIYNSSNGTTVINNTKISNNNSINGAGIRTDGGYLTLNNVTVENNHATSSTLGGGGILLYGGNTTINGGTIQNNTVDNHNGAGIYLGGPSRSPTLTLKGSPYINNNTKSSVQNNLCLANNRIVYVDGLSNTTPIGITTDAIPSSATQAIAITSALSNNYSNKFSSDNPTYAIYNDNNTVRLVIPNVIEKASSLHGSYSVTVEDMTFPTATNLLIDIAEGKLVTVSPSPDSGYCVERITYYNSDTNETSTVQFNDGYSFLMPPGNIIISVVFKRIYTVSFNSNGDPGVMEPMIVESTVFTLPGISFTPAQYKTFAGWAYYANGPKIEADTILVNNDITLFALWDKHKHTFTTRDISSRLQKKSCYCGFYIINFK